MRMHVYVCVWLCVFFMFIYACLFAYLCICVWMRLCFCAYMFVCFEICVFVCIYLPVFVCVYFVYRLRRAVAKNYNNIQLKKISRFSDRWWRGHRPWYLPRHGTYRDMVPSETWYLSRHVVAWWQGLHCSRLPGPLQMTGTKCTSSRALTCSPGRATCRFSRVNQVFSFPSSTFERPIHNQELCAVNVVDKNLLSTYWRFFGILVFKLRRVKTVTRS